MVSIIYVVGFFISIMIDAFCYIMIKKGYRIENFPSYYLTLKMKSLIMLAVGWAIIWPIVVAPSVFNVVKRVFKTSPSR